MQVEGENFLPTFSMAPENMNCNNLPGCHRFQMPSRENSLHESVKISGGYLRHVAKVGERNKPVRATLATTNIRDSNGVSR